MDKHLSRGFIQKRMEYGSALGKDRVSFPTDELALKLLYLISQNISRKWTMRMKNWSQAMQIFSIIFEGARADPV